MADVRLTRDVTRDECPWLDADLASGLEVHEFRGHTYGCISPLGIAVSVKPGEYPFFEVPINAIEFLPKAT